jgi:hypothetical protein
MRRSRAVIASFVLALLAGQPLPATAQENLAAQLCSLFERLPHSSFEWIAVEGVSERAAMRVPVTVDGTECWFQLDTGLDWTVLYGDIAEERGWDAHQGFYHVPSVNIGSIELGPNWLRTRSDMEHTSILKGSIGLDLLVGYLVLIDYPGRRLTMMKHGQAPLWLLQHTTWTPAKLRDKKFFLYVGIAGQGVDDVFFDTGTSAFDVTVDFERWRALTGCSGPEEATSQWKVNSWGQEMTAVGAPAKGPLVIGSARIREPRVFYLKEQPDLFAGWPIQAQGLVGNAPFWHTVVIMDLGIMPRFGILQ